MSDKAVIRPIFVPAVGESITQVTIGTILKSSGTSVSRDEELLEIETDKLNQTIHAPCPGVVTWNVATGQVCAIGEVIGNIEEKAIAEEVIVTAESKPVTAVATPVPKKTIVEFDRYTTRPLSSIRKAISKRLKEAQENSVMLTTFTEVDMSQIMQIRKHLQEDFLKKFQVKLGLMSFFVKAVCMAIEHFPDINSFIQDDLFYTRNYCDIGVAIASERGLVVPIIRDANRLTFAQIEQTLLDFRSKADLGELKIDDLKGGSFSITNGGVFGSLLSTPILNPPQSAILGMHKITDRAVVVDGQIVIRPMMYLALTYDHCVLDGKEAVLFLNTIKKILEEPERFAVELI